MHSGTLPGDPGLGTAPRASATPARRALRTLLVLLLAASLLPSSPPLAAQEEGGSLERVKTLMDDGKVEAARRALETWWAAAYEDAGRDQRQRALWLRGVLTVDPSMAELDYRRLVLEYPGGSFADDALQRLALWADLRGELREAERHYRALVQDYPGSPFRQEARQWLRDHAQALAALPPRDREALDPDSGTPGQGETEEDPDSLEGHLAVQLGAFRSLRRARTLLESLQEAGYSPRLVTVPGSELYRVRTGRFSARSSAEELARELAGRGFESTIVTDVHSEEDVG